MDVRLRGLSVDEGNFTPVKIPELLKFIVGDMVVSQNRGTLT